MPSWFQNMRSTVSNWMGSNGWNSIGGGVSSSIKVPGIERPAANVPTVYSCLRARTSAIQQAALRLSDGRGNLVTGGDLFELLASPARNLDPAAWLGQIECYLSLYDMAAIAKIGEPGRPPDELIPLSPANLQPVVGVHEPSGTARAIGWIYYDGWTGSQRRYAPEDLILINGMNPYSPLRALAPTDAALRIMQGDIAARESNLSLLSNGATPSLVLQTDQKLTPDQANELLNKLASKISGFKNQHKATILTNGLKATKTGLTPMELQFLDGLRFTTSELLMVFRVMPAMLGVMTGETGLSQGSSTQEQKLAWWEDVGIPELGRISSALHQGLVQPYNWKLTTRAMSDIERVTFQRAASRAGTTAGAVSIYFDEGQIPALIKSRLAKLEQFKTILAYGWKPDDVVQFLDLGLPPHPTNVGMIPMSMVPVTDLAGTPKQEAAPAPTTTTTAEPAREIESAFDRLELALERAPAKNDKIRKAFAKLVTAQTKTTARKVSGYFVDQRQRVLERLKNARAMLGERRGEVDDLLGAVFPKGEEDAALVKRLLGAWTMAMEEGWSLTNEQVGATENPFTVEDRRIKAALDKRKIQGAKMNETTEADLREILSSGIEGGLNTTELGDAIAEYYAKHIGETAARPMTAARTQIAGCVNDGQLAAAESVGGLVKFWIHGSPEESRPAHVTAETTYADGIALDAPFTVNGQTMSAPGDAAASVDETANCTCTLGFKKEGT